MQRAAVCVLLSALACLTGCAVQWGESAPADASRGQALLPLYYQWFDSITREQNELLFPLYWSSRDAKGGGQRAVSPFGYSQTLFDRHGKLRKRTTSVLWWFWSDEEPEMMSSALFPFWWQRAEPKKRHTILFPFYWYFENARTDRTTEVFAPFYSHSTEARDEGYEARRSILWPVYRERVTSDGSRWASLLGPIGGLTLDGRTGEYRAWCLLYWANRRDGIDAWGVWPFAVVQESGNGDRAVAAFGGWYDEIGKHVSAGLPPLFEYDADDSRKALSVLGGLYTHTADANGEEKGLFGVIRWQPE